METTITATELARNLSDILSRAQYKGERFVVQRNGETVATIAPAEVRPADLSSLADRLAAIPRPDDKWADDMEAILEERRRELVPESQWPDS